MGSMSKREECNTTAVVALGLDKCYKTAGVALSLDECVHMHGICGLCNGSVKKKWCIGTTTKNSSLYTSAEGGPQSKREGGEAKKVV